MISSSAVFLLAALNEFLDPHISDTVIGKQLAQYSLVNYEESLKVYKLLYPQYDTTEVDLTLAETIKEFNERVKVNIQYFSVW